jgi:hypothetical protein
VGNQLDNFANIIARFIDPEEKQTPQSARYSIETQTRTIKQWTQLRAMTNMQVWVESVASARKVVISTRSSAAAFN